MNKGTTPIRTKRIKIRVGDLMEVDGCPVLLIQHGKKQDFFTLEELLHVFYGQCSCVIVTEDETIEIKVA